MLINGNEIKPATLLPKFSTIDLVIGSGPLRNIQVPNLVGFSVKEAKEIIQRNHFEIGIVNFSDEKDENILLPRP